MSHLKLFPDLPTIHLGGVLGPSPWGTPTSATPVTDFLACFKEEILLGISKLIISNFFMTSLQTCGGLGQSPSPWGTLISARPVTDFRSIFHSGDIDRHIKMSHLKLFSEPPYIWVEFWGHPCPHESPQHQQGQILILEHISSKMYC